MKKGKLLALLLGVVSLFHFTGCKPVESPVINYNVTVQSNNNDFGTVSVSGLKNGSAPAGTEIFITALPKSDYYVDHFTCLESPDLKFEKTGTENVWKFSMPAKDITVTVYFNEIEKETVYSLTILKNDDSLGKVTSSAMEGTAGTEISLTVLPKEDYYVEKIVCSEVPDLSVNETKTANVWSFKMPEKNITLTVYFKEIEKDAVYTLTLVRNDDSLGSVTSSVMEGVTGTEINLTVLPKDGYYVEKFVCSENPSLSVTKTETENVWAFKMPPKNITVTVYFKEIIKLKISDGNSTAGVKLLFENIPEDADRRYIYLGTGDSKRNISEANPWFDYERVKDSSYFYQFTEKDRIYSFTVEYENEYSQKIADATITVTAKGGLGNFEILTPERINISVDKDGNYSYITKPSIIDGTNCRVIVAPFIQPWDAVSPWVDSETAWCGSDYFYAENYFWYNSASEVKYENFSVIDFLLDADAYSETNKDDPEKIASSKKIIDSLVKNKGIIVGLKYYIIDSAGVWNGVKVYDNEFFQVGKNGKGVFVLDPSPLLGTWSGKSKSYTFRQNKVTVEDATSVNTYAYTYTDNTVTFNGETYEYAINSDRTIITLTDDDDNVKKYNRVQFGKTFEGGYEAAEIKVENNTIKFIQAPGAKTVPEGITTYRVDFCTEADDYGFINVANFDSLTFNDIDIDSYVWDKELRNKKLKLNILWGNNGWNSICDTIELSNYQVAPDYELPKTSIDGTVVTMTKPGSKILALYPNTDHYTVFVHNEANKYSDWIGYKDFALTDNIIFDLCTLGIDPEKIINNQVNLCLELKAANENMEKRLTDNNWVPFSGYKYNVNLSENSAGINNGISINMSGVPSEAKSCQIHILKGAIGHQIYWTDNPSELKKTSFFYPFVNANTEYTIQVSYYGEDIKLSQSIIKITPKGGLGELLPVNANDVSCKVESKSLIWETKPTFVNHTGGYVSIGFFGENWDGYYGEVHVDYALLKTSAYTKIDLSENVDVDGFMVYFDKTIPRKGVLQYIYHADDGSGLYDGYSSEIEFKNHAFEYVPPVPKTITIEDVEESVVLAKNYPWVDGVQDTTQEMINYEASLDVTELYGSDLPKKFDEIHLIWNGVSDKDIKKLNVAAVDKSEAAGYWTDLSNRWEVVKENIKANTPFTIEYDLMLTRDSIENINLVFSVDPEDVSGVPTITKVSK